MGLFKNNTTEDTANGYRGLGKDQLIDIIQSQKSENEFLQKKLSEATAAVTASQSQNADPEELNALRAENEQLRRQLDEMNAEFEKVGVIADRNEELAAELAALKAQPAQPAEPTEPTNPGSIAEMSVQVSGVMTAAQKAADDYLAKIKAMHDEMCQEHSRYELESQQKADEILKNANAEANSIVNGAKRESNEIWQSLSSVFRKYCGDKEYEFN